MRPPGRLFVLCGLPASGKTTLAKELEAANNAVRFCPDDWFKAMGTDLWDQQLRHEVEALQWETAQRLLRLGVNAVIEFGSWARAERDVLREGARAIGAAVELHYLEAPIDELVRRLEGRNRLPGEAQITRVHLEEWAEVIDVPTPEEFALFDPPSSSVA